MKKLFSSLLMLCLLLPSVLAGAQDSNVKVNIAPFYTEIDYMSVDNRYVEFPLITYKDITYFPMTYNLCERLDLVSGFDSQKGLFISRSSVDSYADAREMFGGSANNSYDKLYNASIPTYPIYLNGIKIDNSREEYPLLNFRNVTYFPMTWRFAHEELNFDIDWSDENYSFKLYNNGRHSAPYAYKVDNDSIYFQDKIDVRGEYTDEDGKIHDNYLLYSYYNHYKLDLVNEEMTTLESTSEREDYALTSNSGSLEGKKVDAVYKENKIYIGDFPIFSSVSTDTTSDIYAIEYSLGDTSLIYVESRFGNTPAPYTQHSEYLFKKTVNGIENLGWNEKNNLSGIYPDNKGGYYIASSGYSVVQTARWTNAYSDIYYYNPQSSQLVSLTEKYSDTLNSMRAIGMSNGKLYIEAMWYAEDKESAYQASHFSAVNSGFYELEFEEGTLKKLYPYISGETFIAPNGTLYCNANYAYSPRLVNLNTGNIISFE